MRRTGAGILRHDLAFFEAEVGTGMDRSLPKSLIDRFCEVLALSLLCPSVFVLGGVTIVVAKVDSARDVWVVAGVSMLFALSFAFLTDVCKMRVIGEDMLIFQLGGVGSIVTTRS